MTHATLQAGIRGADRPLCAGRSGRHRVHLHRRPDLASREQYLLFSDMPGDVRRRWDRRGVSETAALNKGNGMTYDPDLNLLVCEHATSTLVRETPDGRREILASHFEGRELNTPNDVCVADGSI